MPLRFGSMSCRLPMTLGCVDSRSPALPPRLPGMSAMDLSSGQLIPLVLCALTNLCFGLDRSSWTFVKRQSRIHLLPFLQIQYIINSLQNLLIPMDSVLRNVLRLKRQLSLWVNTGCATL